MNGSQFAWGRPMGPGWGARARRQRDPFLFILLLQFWQQYQQLPWKPPLTVALIAAQALMHFKDELPLPWHVLRLVPPVQRACLNPFDVVVAGDWSRLLWSAFIHLDDRHLYYNMSSLLLKGATLERRLGSARLALLLAELTLLSTSIMAWGLYFVGEYLQFDWSWSRHTCAVGFSGVLFALKYVLSHGQEGSEQLWLAGWHVPLPVRLPVKYIAWAELLLIHLLVPGTSFAGHLAGILAGVLHVHVILPALQQASTAARRAQAAGWQGQSRQQTASGRNTWGRTAGGTASTGATARNTSTTATGSRDAQHGSSDEDWEHVAREHEPGPNAAAAAAAAALQRAQRAQEHSLRRRL